MLTETQTNGALALEQKDRVIIIPAQDERPRSVRRLRYPGAFGDYKFNHFSATTPSPDDNFM